ncbi:MAG: 30S ribosomal protein S16 [Clostridia bacterium]|nr:30S ribosomal protein S16 [Clostridia bacterium]
MVKIRLTRIGKKKQPAYRIVAIDERKARDAEYLEQIGYYDPTKDPKICDIDKDLAAKWLNNGAQPTDTVRRLFKSEGIIK